MFLPVNPLPHVLALVQDARNTFQSAAQGVNPITIATFPRPIADLGPVLTSARTGADLVTEALGLAGANLSPAVRSALRSAVVEANSGIRLLSAGSAVAQDPVVVAGRFDSAATWLGIAEGLVRAELGLPPAAAASA